MEALLLFYAKFLAMSQANPMVAGMIGLWGAGTITWLLKSVPGKIWTFGMSQSTTSVSFNNSGYGANGLNYQCFLSWYQNTSWSKFSRKFALQAREDDDGNDTKDSYLGAGYGSHWFFYKGRLFWFNKNKTDSAGVSEQKEEITITGLTRSRELVFELVQEFKYRKAAGEIRSFDWCSHGYWHAGPKVPERHLDTVMLDQETKDLIVAKITEFNESRDWYLERGIPYKMVFALHGPPGTGKTSLVRALACHFEAAIHSLNLSMMSDSNLRSALGSVGKKAFLLIEDFDSSTALHARKALKVKKAKPKVNDTELALVGDSPDEVKSFSMLTLSGFLNAIDGVIPLDGTIVFMTTNDLSNIDPAVLRKGRVDWSIHIGLLGDKEIKQYIQNMFPGHLEQIGMSFAPIAGCDLYAMFSEYRYDPATFVAMIPRIIDNAA